MISEVFKTHISPKIWHSFPLKSELKPEVFERTLSCVSIQAVELIHSVIKMALDPNL